MKLCIIGSGSSYTPTIINEIIKRNEELGFTSISLMDINSRRLEIIYNFCMLFIKNTSIILEKTIDLNACLENADYVITTIRVGGLVSRSSDKKICNSLKLIGQETVGGGGAALSIRTIPYIINITENMKAICPNAWLINGTNPDGIITKAILKSGFSKVIGLCDIPFHMQLYFANFFNVDRKKIRLDSYGLNHLSWVQNIYVDNIDQTDIFWNNFNEEEYISKATNIPAMQLPTGFIKRMKLFPSPYLNYYLFPDKILDNQIRSIKNRADICIDIEKELFSYYANSKKPIIPEIINKRGGSRFCEVIIDVIQNLSQDSGDIQIICTQNKDTIDELANDCIVEIPCKIHKNGPIPIKKYKLAEEIKGLVIMVSQYEQLLVDAIFSRQKIDILYALINNPLILSIDKSIAFLNKICESYKEHLGYLI